MSEGTITQTSLFDSEEVTYNTIGLPVSPADEWKIVDKDDGHVIAESVHDGTALHDGTARWKGEAEKPGEIIFRGPYTIRGYYNAPDHNKKGGEKFSCEEVENLVLKNEKVHDAALVPMPDPVLGEKACLFVSLRDPNETITLEEIITFLDGKLAKFKLPERLEVRPDLPHTNIGKVKKEELRQEIYAIMAEEEKNKK